MRSTPMVKSPKLHTPATAAEHPAPFTGMINCHTMTKAKIAITVSPLVLNRLDAWVKSGHYASRSEAIEQAVEAQLQRL